MPNQMAVYKRFSGKRIKRGDKNYDRATWYYKFVIKGVTYHRAVREAKTLAQAKEAEDAVRNAIFQNRYGQMTDRTTFSSFIKSVYLDYVEQNNTNIYSKKIFIQELEKHFGDRLLKEITPQDCRNYITARRKQPTIHGRTRKGSSINKELSTLSKIFNLAIEEGKIENNPMRFVKMEKEEDARSRILSPDEFQRFNDALADDRTLYRLSMIAMHTGLRKGQILALEMKHIDFENGIVKAAPSKGRKSRPVALNRTMFRLFREIESEQPEGKIFPFSDFRKRWDNMCEKADLADFNFHDLKHHFATELVRHGMSPQTVQMLFAHSDISITEKYIHGEMELMRKAVEMLDDIQELGEL